MLDIMQTCFLYRLPVTNRESTPIRPLCRVQTDQTALEPVSETQHLAFLFAKPEFSNYGKATVYVPLATDEVVVSPLRRLVD